MSFIKKLAGKTGSAIDRVGGAFGDRLPEFNISESLQSFGGAPQGQPYVYVPPSKQATLSGGFSAATDKTFSGGFSAATDKTFQPKGDVLGDKDVAGGLSGLGGAGDPGFSDIENSARERERAELSSLNTSFDRQRSEIENQLPYLQRERERGLSSITDQQTAMKNSIERQKLDAGESQDSQIKQAGDIARQTQLQNRNMLRALGILSSSAAGELLAKPLNEFGSQRADIVAETQKRYGILDDFLNEKTYEMSRAVESLEDDYSQLIGQVQSDLRFNERERADAIKSVNAALSERMAEIKNMQFNYQSQINALKQNYAAEAASLENWKNPVYEEQKITDMQIQPSETQTSRQQASIFQPQRDEDEYGLSALA